MKGDRMGCHVWIDYREKGVRRSWSFEWGGVGYVGSYFSFGEL